MIMFLFSSHIVGVYLSKFIVDITVFCKKYVAGRIDNDNVTLVFLSVLITQNIRSIDFLFKIIAYHLQKEFITFDTQHYDQKRNGRISNSPQITKQKTKD